MMFLFGEPNDYSTHTFLIYEDKGMWNLFEHSDYCNRGIHVFESLEEALRYEMKYHIDLNSKFAKMDEDVIKRLHVIEYDVPEYDIDFEKFVNYVLENGKDVTMF